METLEAIGLDPCHSACDRLLVYFRNRHDITFLSVTHTIEHLDQIREYVQSSTFG